VLAAVVLTAVAGLLDFPALLRMWRVSGLDFYAATIALIGVLLLGILQGILLSALASILLLLGSVVPRTNSRYRQILGPRAPPRKRDASRRDRFPARSVAPLRQRRGGHGDGLAPAPFSHPIDIRLVVCDLSASPYVDLAGSRMLHELHGELAAKGIALRVVGAHGGLRDLLRADGLGEKVGRLDRVVTLDRVLGGEGR
jgi:SulP family sulfate permease